MLRLTLRNLFARKLRLLLSGFAVILGVTFVSGAMVLTETISHSFERGMAHAYDDIDVVVTGEAVPTAPVGMPQTSLIPADAVDRLGQLPQVDGLHAEIWTENVRPIGDDGSAITTFSTHVGSNWVTDGDAGGLVELREGTGPSADDEVVVNAELARLADLEVGDRLSVLTLEPRQEFTVVGIFGYAGGRDSWFGETQVAFTDPVAQELLLGERDVYTELSLAAATGTSAQELRDAVANGLGDGYVVRTGEQALAAMGDDIRDELGFLGDVLLGFAVVALLVGAFLVFNTFSILVAQRIRELALLRAFGAGRRQVVGVVLVEALVIGVLAATVGLGLGIGIAMLLTAWLGTEIQLTPVLAVPGAAVVAAYAVGVLVTIAAALVPAIKASRVAPVAAMRGAEEPDRSLTRLTVAGVVAAAVGGALLVAGLVGELTQASVAMVLGGVVLAFVAVVLLTPVLVRPVVAVVGRVFAWSIPGELGRRNTARQPRRTAITAAALMIGVALVTGASTFFGSFAASFGQALEGRLSAELVIAGEPTELAAPTFDRQVVDDARSMDEVEHAAAFWFASVEIGDDEVAVQLTDDLPAWLAMTGVEVLDGDAASLGTGQLALAERIADRQELAVGDRLDVALPRGGVRSFEVAAVYERNDVFEVPILSADDAAELGLVHPSEGFVSVAEGADVGEVRSRLEGALVDSPEVSVLDRSGYVEQQTRQFDEAIVFVQVLLVLAMVIAVLGVVNTLALSIVERTRELGLLRALGLGRLATARMVAVESVVVSLFGALLGITTGVGLGAAIVTVLRDEGFSELALPWGLMVAYLVAAALVGVIAAVVPAARTARLDVLQAIADE